VAPLRRPEHPATCALLEPLNRDIPADIAERLKPQPGLDASSVVVELTYMGKSGLEPDPLAIAKAFGGKRDLTTAGAMQ
jgi:D-methionine transport system ATP-binding protein